MKLCVIFQLVAVLAALAEGIEALGSHPKSEINTITRSSEQEPGTSTDFTFPPKNEYCSVSRRLCYLGETHPDNDFHDASDLDNTMSPGKSAKNQHVSFKDALQSSMQIFRFLHHFTDAYGHINEGLFETHRNRILSSAMMLKDYYHILKQAKCEYLYVVKNIYSLCYKKAALLIQVHHLKNERMSKVEDDLRLDLVLRLKTMYLAFIGIFDENGFLSNVGERQKEHLRDLVHQFSDLETQFETWRDQNGYRPSQITNEFISLARLVQRIVEFAIPEELIAEEGEESEREKQAKESKGEGDSKSSTEVTKPHEFVEKGEETTDNFDSSPAESTSTPVEIDLLDLEEKLLALRNADGSLNQDKYERELFPRLQQYDKLLSKSSEQHKLPSALTARIDKLFDALAGQHHALSEKQEPEPSPIAEAEIQSKPSPDSPIEESSIVQEFENLERKTSEFAFDKQIVDTAQFGAELEHATDEYLQLRKRLVQLKLSSTNNEVVQETSANIVSHLAQMQDKLQSFLDDEEVARLISMEKDEPDTETKVQKNEISSNDPNSSTTQESASPTREPVKDVEVEAIEIALDGEKIATNNELQAAIMQLEAIEESFMDYVNEDGSFNLEKYNNDKDFIKLRMQDIYERFQNFEEYSSSVRGQYLQVFTRVMNVYTETMKTVKELESKT